MKMLKKVFVFLLILSPLLAVPKQSKAGLIGDLISDIFGGGKDKDKKPKPSSGNSVPVNGGLVFLVIAGAGLGAKMIYDRKKGQKESAAI
jgi:hypothetical protein